MEESDREAENGEKEVWGSRRSSEDGDESDSSSASASYSSKTSTGDAEAVSKLALPVSKRIIDSDKALSDTWVVWAEQGSGRKEEFGSCVEVQFEFDTMHQFHAGWKGLQERRLLVRDRTFCVFRRGVRPLWEDERNKHGGKFLIGLPQACMEHTLDCWFTLVTGITCERFSGCHNLMGASLTLRAWGSMITLWNREATDFKQIYKVKKKLKKLFEIPKIKYQAHQFRISADKRPARKSDSDESPRRPESHHLSMPGRLSDSSSDESNFESYRHPYPLTYRRFVNNSYGASSRPPDLPLLPQRKSDGSGGLPRFSAERLFYSPQHFGVLSLRADEAPKAELPIPRPPPPKYSMLLGAPSPLPFYLPI